MSTSGRSKINGLVSENSSECAPLYVLILHLMPQRRLNRHVTYTSRITTPEFLCMRRLVWAISCNLYSETSIRKYGKTNRIGKRRDGQSV